MCIGLNNTKRTYNKRKTKFTSVMTLKVIFSFFSPLFSTCKFTKMSLYQIYIQKKKANIHKWHYNSDKAEQVVRTLFRRK